MINPKITEAIESQFTKERFIFWCDTDAEYDDCINDLSMHQIKIINIDKVPALSIKIEIADSDFEQKFLFYSTKPEPSPIGDWLLAYRLKGKSFSADSTQILLDELGLSSHSLRDHLKLRAKFLAAKDRVERLKKWISHDDDAERLDLKILTVLSRADQAEPFSIFNQVLSATVDEQDVDFDQPSRIWSDIVQYQLEEVFWLLAKKTFGYVSDKPTLKNLLMCLFVSDFASSLTGNSSVPNQLLHFVLDDGYTKSNAKVFVSRWRSDVSLMNAYIQLTQSIADEIKIDELLINVPSDALCEVMTFDGVERIILTTLKSRVINHQFDASLLEVINRRKNGFWANLKVAKDFELTRAYAACYDAIESAQSFLLLKSEYENGFSFPSASDGLSAYKKSIYQFDQTYRNFHYASNLVEHMGWQLLRDLTDLIENSYSGWFIPQFSSAWSKVVEGEHGLLNDWHIDGWVNQYQFYDKYVNKLLSGNVKRVFVLISDAFRYEAAESLTTTLNARNKYQAQIDAMLGVLPSYTSLGMAALLPHKTLKYKRGQNLSVLADDLPTSGLEQRSAVLNQYEGVAIKHEDLLALGKEKGREFVKPFKVVYIYHDRVDAIGDKQSTETKTFEAVKQTIEELSQAVSFVFNSLSASTLYLTADHGFMYQDSALENVDKSNLGEKPHGAIVTKKRYLIGDAIGATSQAWYGNTHKTANTVEGDGSVDFWVPKAANRFHFAGGARFVHGSAMPQEIVVPLITIKQLESEKSKSKFVDVHLLGSLNKVVTNMQRFELIQTEQITEYVLSRTLKLSIQDDQTSISDVQIVTFDKSGQSIDERKVSIILTLKAGNYDRLKEYYFSAKDIDSGVEVIRLPIKIDLAFTNDF